MATMCMGHRSPSLCNKCKKLPRDVAEELDREWVQVRRDPQSRDCIYFDYKRGKQ